MNFCKILVIQFIVFLTSCHLQSGSSELKNTTFLAPHGEEIAVEIALLEHEQRQGLSGRKAESFCQNCAMLFYYHHDSTKNFWMIDTYMNLDIFFLDGDLRIVEIERQMPAHPGKEEPPTIARTLPIFSRHVLEMRSDSPLSKKLEKGMKFQWKDPKIKKILESEK